MTGGVIIEINNDEEGTKADLLKNKLGEVLDSSKIKVSRPVKKMQLKLSRIDDSIASGEIAQALARVGGCQSDVIECSEIKSFRGSMEIACVQCPARIVLKIKEQGESITIGWSKVKVEVLKPRPIQCFRCLAAGHIFQRCPSSVDRRDDCRKCDQRGHFAKWCNNPVNCPVCEERRKPCKHKAGSVNCPPIPPIRGRRDSPQDVAERGQPGPAEMQMECEEINNGEDPPTKC